MSNVDILKLHIKFGPIEFDAEGDKETVLAERKEIFSSLLSNKQLMEPSPADSPGQPIEASVVSYAQVASTNNTFGSFNELQRKLGLSSDVDLVAGAAYYLAFCCNQPNFDKKDIDDVLKKAHLILPGNSSRAIALNIRKGFLRELAENEKDTNSKLNQYTYLHGLQEWADNHSND